MRPLVGQKVMPSGIDFDLVTCFVSRYYVQRDLLRKQDPGSEPSYSDGCSGSIFTQ